MKKTVKSYILFLAGLFTAALGVAFSTKAGLGTSPVATVPYSVSLVNGSLSFGWWLNIWNLVMIGLQILILRKKCRPADLIIQTVITFIYGYLTDFWCMVTDGLKADTYFLQLLFMFISCFILAFGLFLQFKGGVSMLPGEGLNRAISMVTGKRYETIKVFFDLLYIGIAAVICMVFIGELKGVREGSIIAGVLVGNIIRLYRRLFDGITDKKEAA